MWDVLKKKVRSAFGKRAPHLVVDNSGPLLVDGDKSSQYLWNDLREVRAWKLDCGCYDSIQIGLEFADGRWIQLDEGDAGYRELVAALEQRFTLRDGWRGELAFPAFAYNLTILWAHRERGQRHAI